MSIYAYYGIYCYINVFIYTVFVFTKGGINESDLSQEEELAVLKEQHALLTRLLHQQQEVSCDTKDEL